MLNKRLSCLALATLTVVLLTATASAQDVPANIPEINPECEDVCADVNADSTQEEADACLYCNVANLRPECESDCDDTPVDCLACNLDKNVTCYKEPLLEGCPNTRELCSDLCSDTRAGDITFCFADCVGIEEQRKSNTQNDTTSATGPADGDTNTGEDMDGMEFTGAPGCCRAATAECLACAAGETIEEYCKAKPETLDCPPAHHDEKEWKSYVHASVSGEATSDSRKKPLQRYSVHALSDTMSTVIAKGENAKGKATAAAKANVDDWWGSQADSKSETSAEVVITDGVVEGAVSEHLDANSNGKYSWGEAKGKASAKGYGYIWKKNMAAPDTPPEDKWEKKWKKPSHGWKRPGPWKKHLRPKWGHKKAEE